MIFARRVRFFAGIVAIVVLLVALKAGVHALRLESLPLDTLFSSVVAGTIFIIGFLLSGLMPDYKEAERMSGEIRVSLEAIHDDATAFARQSAGVRLDDIKQCLLDVVGSFERGLGDRQDHAHLGAAIARADDLAVFILEFERLGMTQNYVVRLRSTLDVLRKALYRTYYIQRIEFLPSVHMLIQALAGAVLVLLLLLKTDGSIGSALIFAPLRASSSCSLCI